MNVMLAEAGIRAASSEAKGAWLCGVDPGLRQHDVCGFGDVAAKFGAHGAQPPCTINRMIEIAAKMARVSSGGGYGSRLAPG
jgi:hypothetical protein